MVGGTGSPDHARAPGEGELNGGAADPTCCTVDEQAYSMTHAECVQAARGRLEGNGEASGVDKTEGQRDRRPMGQQRQFGRSGAIVGNTEDPVTDSDISNTFSYLVDDARHVAARRLRQPCAEVQQAPAQLPVRRIDTRRAHDDPYLSGTGMWVGKIHDLENLGTSEPAELRCLHHAAFSNVKESVHG